MKRILYFHHAGGIGGAPLSLLYLIRQLDPDRYEPVVVMAKDGPAVTLYRAQGIETYVIDAVDDFSHTTLEWYGGRFLWRLPGKLLRLPRSIDAARKAVERFQPDVVHLNSSTLAPAALGVDQTGVPLVWHIREPLAQGYVGLRRRWIRRTVDRCADRVVAICQNDADQLIPSDRIRVIYNFVHFDQFDRSLSGKPIREEFDIAPDAPIVAMLGGVSEPKGTLTLVQAVPHLLREVPEARVLVAGHPPRATYGRSVKELGKRLLGVNAYQKAVQRTLLALTERERSALIFTGMRQDIPRILAASTCLTFPSSVPHFARPIIEAAAMGIPSVASDLGGPRELIVEGETGQLVPPKDPQALGGTLVALLTDRQRTQTMGEKAYLRARNLFDAETNATATIDLYDELLLKSV